MTTKRLTKRCRDGRACAGSLWHEPVFVLDDQEYCDSCLAARYDLSSVYDSCCCGHYSEQNGFSTDSVLRVLRGQVTPTRYYVSTRTERLDAKGKITEDPVEFREFRVHYGVYDSEQPWPREPLEEWGPPRFKHPQDRAYKRTKELNETHKGETH